MNAPMTPRGYRIEHPDATTVRLAGTLRLESKEDYHRVLAILQQTLDDCGERELTIELSDLAYLNSSGVSALSIFLIQAREAGTGPIRIQGSAQHGWQRKSLHSFGRLWDRVTVELLEPHSS